MRIRPEDVELVVELINPVASFRRFTVLVDGSAEGTIGPGEVQHFRVSPGRHSVKLKIDWCGSPRLDLEKQPAENLVLRCGVGINDWRCGLAPFIQPQKYLYVREAAGEILPR